MRRRDVFCSALLLGVTMLVWLPRLGGPIDLRFDAGVYYITGTALAQGKGYRLLNEPGEVQAVQYPPLLPALVAVHQLALGSADPAEVGPWLRRSYCLLSLLYALAAYGMARWYLTPVHACFVGLISTLHLWTLYLSDTLFAEVPFALITVLFVCCNQRSEQPRYFVLAALLGGLAYLVRTAGITLLAAWVVDGLLRGSWKQTAIRAAIAAIPVIAWQGYVTAVTFGEEYRRPAYAYQRAPYQNYNVSYGENIVLVDPFAPERGRASAAEFAGRLLRNVRVVPRCFGEGVTAKPDFWAWLSADARQLLHTPRIPSRIISLYLLAVGALVGMGAGVMLSRRQWFVPLYLGVSVLLLCLTPWPDQFPRYLAPYTPFLALCLLHALIALRGDRPVVPRLAAGVPPRVSGPAASGPSSRWNWARTRWRAGSVALAVVIGIALTLETYTATRCLYQRYEEGGTCFFYGQDWQDYHAALAWVHANAEPDDVVVAAVPHWAHLHTSRKAVLPPMEPDPEKAQTLLDSVPARYVIVDGLPDRDMVRRYTVPVLETHPERWRLVYTAPGRSARVFRRQD